VFKRNHATKLGKRKKKFEKGFFLCCVFMKGQTLKLGSLGRTLEGSLKKKTSKVSCRFSLVCAIFMVVFSWALLVFVVMISSTLLVFLVIVLLGFVGVGRI
jgi:hypothetical protein